MKQVAVFISGPSGSGKTPTINALRQRLPLERECLTWTSRELRIEKGEKNGIDYFFASQETILALPDDSFLKRKVHDDQQAVDLIRLVGSLSMHKAIIDDMFHTFVPRLRSFLESMGVVVITIFLTPVTKDEYEQAPDKTKLIKERVAGNIEKRSPGKKVPPSRLDSAVREIETAFSPNQKLYDDILNAVPEYIWDKEQNPMNPTNSKAVELLKKLEQLITNKAPWPKKL